MEKLKKILAVSFALVISFGAIFFSGCTLTDEQQEAIDSLTAKTGNIESILEKTEKKLTAGECVQALKLVSCNLAYLTTESGVIEDSFVVTSDVETYAGFFEKKVMSYNVIGALWNEKNTNGDVARAYTYSGQKYDNVENYTCNYFSDSDYVNNVFYVSSNPQNATFSKSTIPSKDNPVGQYSGNSTFIYNAILSLTDSIKEDNIVEVEETEDGFNCKAIVDYSEELSPSEKQTNKMIISISIKDNKIEKMESKQITQTISTETSAILDTYSINSSYTFKYDSNFDFSNFKTYIIGFETAHPGE